MSSPRHRLVQRRLRHLRERNAGDRARRLGAARNDSEQAVSDTRRRKGVRILSWLSLIFGVIGLVLAAIPNVFFTGALFLVPAFILGLVALALRSDRVWAAVVGVTAAALGGHVTIVSLVLVLVLFGSSFKLPSFDLTSLLKGFDLSAIKLPKLELPKLGGLGIPSASGISKLLDTVKKSSPSPAPSPKPSPGPKPGPTPTPTPTPVRVFAIGEVITNDEGLALMVYDVECGITSISTNAGEVTPDGQFCEAYVVIVNTGDQSVTLDIAAVNAVVGSDDVAGTELASGFWRVDADGTDFGDENSPSSASDSQLPDLNSQLGLEPGQGALGIVSFDIAPEERPSYVVVQGDLFPRGVLIQCEL